MADIKGTQDGPLTTLAKIQAARTGGFGRIDPAEFDDRPTSGIVRRHDVDTAQLNAVLKGVKAQQRRQELTGDFKAAELLVRAVFENYGGQGVDIQRAVFDTLVDAVCERKKRWIREDAVDLEKVPTIPHGAIMNALAAISDHGQRTTIPCSEFLDVCARAYFAKPGDIPTDTPTGGTGSSGNSDEVKAPYMTPFYYTMRGSVDEPFGLGAILRPNPTACSALWKIGSLAQIKI